MNRIVTTSDKSHTLFNAKVGDHYHSTHGAISESKHIYIDHGLKPLKLDSIKVLECGFGTGLNALLAIQYALKLKVKIHYDTYEPYPLEKELIDSLNYTSLLDIEESTFQNIHQTAWNALSMINDFFILNKIPDSILNIHSQSEYDIVFYDAFAPDLEPKLWNLEVFSRLYNSLKDNGVVVTYSTKGTVKRAFKQAGFQIEKFPGPIGGKRENLLARKI